MADFQSFLLSAPLYAVAFHFINPYQQVAAFGEYSAAFSNSILNRSQEVGTTTTHQMQFQSLPQQ